MALIDKDQIRAEIERLKDTACRRADNRYGREDANTYEAWAGAYEKVLEILDTLPEQPVENPQKRKFVFPKFLYARTTDNKTIDVSYAPQNLEAIEYVRNDFVKPEQPVEGLEEEIDRFENWMETYNQADYPTSYTTRDIARHFAEWQKKQDDLETADLLAIAHLQGMEQQKVKMLEDAVEGEIQMRYSGCLCAKTIRTINEDKFKLGDKVRVIVIKED